MVVLLFILGLFFLSKGGDLFLDASVWMAETFHIPKVIVGATIMTIGTTLPEMIITVWTALKGNTGLAVSNALGSVSVNFGLVLPILVLFHPFEIRRKDYVKKTALIFLTAFALAWFGWDGMLNTAESLALAALFALFLFINIQEARSEDPPSDDDFVHPEKSASPKKKRALVSRIVKFVLGAAGIYFGSQLLIDNGILLAKAIGIPETVIGFTAMGIGSSMPELVTAVKSIRQGKTGVSVGNVIGSSIIVTTLIFSLGGFFSRPGLPVPELAVLQTISLYIGLAAVIFIPSLIRQRFSRWQALLAGGIYVFYVVWMFL